MYKVFVNEHLLLFSNSPEIKSDFPCAQELLPEQLLEVIKNCLNAEGKRVFHLDKPAQEGMDLLQQQVRSIQASGGVVRNQSGDFLFIYRFNKWDLPKGWTEEGEKLEDGALREVKEECGLENLALGTHLTTTYHIYATKKHINLKISDWFDMYSEDTALIAQKEEGITDVKWVKKEDLTQVMNNTYPNIALVIDMAIGLH